MEENNDKGASETDTIIAAMEQVKARGLTKEQIMLLFDGQSEVSTREALLVSHIQFLENKAEFMLGALEEIAAFVKGPVGEMAEKVLEVVSPGRNPKGADKNENEENGKQS